MAEWLSLIRAYCFFYPPPPPPVYRGRGTSETGSGRFHDHPNSLLVFTPWPPPPRNILNLQWWGSVLASLSPLLSPHLSHSLWLCPHLWHLTVAQWQPVVRSVAVLSLLLPPPTWSAMYLYHVAAVAPPIPVFGLWRHMVCCKCRQCGPVCGEVNPCLFVF